MVGNFVKCKCGSQFHSITQLKNVHQLGLSLRGYCASCGERLAVNQLWKLKKIIRVKEGGKWHLH